MHFAVLARNLAIGINDNSGVVVQPWCGLFKNGIDDHHLVLLATTASALVVGPSAGSARSNTLGSIFWQK